ncbi:MAG: hypothetical protein ACI9TO_001282, partial [Rickettsiales bacterium]
MLNHKNKTPLGHNNKTPLGPNSVIGIFGGGQLGRMICFEAHKLGYKT